MTRRRLDPFASEVCTKTLVRGPAGFEKTTAIIDTGATFCVFPVETLETLGYNISKPVQKVKVIGVTTETLPLFRIRSIEALGVKVEECLVGAFNLPEEATISALLGLSFLRRLRFTLNMPEGWLSFHTPKASTASPA